MSCFLMRAAASIGLTPISAAAPVVVVDKLFHNLLTFPRGGSGGGQREGGHRAWRLSLWVTFGKGNKENNKALKDIGKGDKENKVLKNIKTAQRIARLSEVVQVQASLNDETARANTAAAEAVALRLAAAVSLARIEQLEASVGESAKLRGKLATAKSKIEAAQIELEWFKLAASNSAELAGRLAAVESKIVLVERRSSGGSIAGSFISASSQHQFMPSERARMRDQTTRMMLLK
ncbi:hypothetical protein T492DRAFT_908960 [Pavlovales sp. CCMP2436]|nr:hypothetical protein T492DRAFT_908960 [Pavlovales sp. CCMP2436]